MATLAVWKTRTNKMFGQDYNQQKKALKLKNIVYYHQH